MGGKHPDPTSDAHFKSERATVVARRLRRTMTHAECALWTELRRLPLKGTHFRRQAPLGPFIVDFVCHRACLVVEVDGGAHNAPDVALRDAERTHWLAARGYKVLRFGNTAVLKSPSVVAQAILAEIRPRLRCD